MPMRLRRVIITTAISLSDVSPHDSSCQGPEDFPVPVDRGGGLGFLQAAISLSGTPDQ